MDIKINEAYSHLVRPLSHEEYETLKSSIKERGLHLPIIVNDDGEILDGHNRYRICQELGIKPATIEKSFDDPIQERIFVIESNLKRRQLADFERVELVKSLEPLEGELAEKRRRANLKVGSRAPVRVPSSSFEQVGSVREIMADKASVSEATYYRASAVIEEGSEELKEEVREGKKSVNKAYEQVKGKGKERKPREAKDVFFIPVELLDRNIEASQEAKQAGKPLPIRTDGHNVLSIGAEVEITT